MEYKFCPLLTLGGGPTGYLCPCKYSECAWFDDELRNCAIVSIAESMNRTDEDY